MEHVLIKRYRHLMKIIGFASKKLYFEGLDDHRKDLGHYNKAYGRLSTFESWIAFTNGTLKFPYAANNDCEPHS
jgi:hypothetical protein